MVLQEQSGEDGGQYLDKSLHKIWAWLEDILSIRHEPISQASMIQSHQPLTPVVMGDCAFLLESYWGLCMRRIDDAHLKGKQPEVWLIDSTSGGHTNAIARSLTYTGPVLGEAAAQAGSIPGCPAADGQCLSTSSQAAVQPFIHH